MTPADLGLIETLAWHANSNGVKSMIDLGFPVNSRSKQGDTALHAASYLGDAESVKALIQAGADLEAKDTEYQGTPLGWVDHAAMNGFRKEGDYVACAKLLLEAGAKAPSQFGSSEIKQVFEQFSQSK